MTARPYLYGTNITGAGLSTTATVTTGSNLVTGVGSPVWTGISFADWFSMGGVSVPILEIVDDTHLHLAYNWPGGNITAGAYTVSAGIDSTDARRYGWYVAQYYQRLANLPADTQSFRDQAVAAAAASATSATASAASATLSSAWSSTAFNTDVPGASVGSRSALHYSVVAGNNATLASTNGAAQVTLAAAQVTLATAQVAIAQLWSSQSAGADVTTPGTRSAFHWSNQANITYNNTVGVQTTIQGYLSTVTANVQLSADWAQKPVGQDVNGVGTRSSLHWSSQAQTYASNSASSASAAASSASAAANSALILGNPDYGLITVVAGSNVDYGTVP
jgi:hypothetical protein